MDIEGDEWEVLKDIATKPYLDLIGQVSAIKQQQQQQQKRWNIKINNF